MTAVSVILTAYNEGKYIAEMLECIKNQTFKDFELIIVNDGSTDDTQKIIEEYSNSIPNKKKILVQENQGISVTRNNGMDVAEGEYIAFLDGDDVIPPDYLEKLYNAAVSAQADISKCSFEDFDQFGNRSGFISVTARDVEFAEGKRYLFQYSPWGGLLKREFVEKFNIRFSPGEQMEDSPFALITNQLAANYAIVPDEELVYLHRIHKGSIMANVAEAKTDPRIPYRGFEEAINKVRENTPDEFRTFSDYCFVRVMTDYSTQRYDTQNKSTRRELIDYMYRIMDTYFPDFPQNPYLSPGKLKQLPLFEKAAVRMFAGNYKRHTLYAFSYLVSVALRFRK